MRQGSLHECWIPGPLKHNEADGVAMQLKMERRRERSSGIFEAGVGVQEPPEARQDDCRAFGPGVTKGTELSFVRDDAKTFGAGNHEDFKPEDEPESYSPPCPTCPETPTPLLAFTLKNMARKQRAAEAVLRRERALNEKHAVTLE